VVAVPDFHRVKTPTPLEFPPPTTRPAAQPTAWDWLVLYVARPLWGFRVELAAALAVLLAWRWLAALLGRGPAALLLAAAIGGPLAVPAVRRRVVEVEHRARVRRRWATACRYAGLATGNDRVPHIARHQLVPAGDRLLVRLPAGSSTAALAEAAEQVAVILDVREVRVARDPDHAALARVTVVRRDPLHGAPPLGWPWLDAERCSLWVPVPVGVDEDGQWVHIALPERNVLLGGEPGSGKSAAMALLLAAAALDPSVKLILLDGKLVELACWAGVAERSIGPDLAEAVAVLVARQP
jgi:DNA translocase FtsK/SpoIIIE-like protein